MRAKVDATFGVYSQALICVWYPGRVFRMYDIAVDGTLKIRTHPRCVLRRASFG
jgi:hypothetical protein